MGVRDGPYELVYGCKSGEIPPSIQSSVLPKVVMCYVSHIKRVNDISRLACFVAMGLNSLIRVMAARKKSS